LLGFLLAMVSNDRWARLVQEVASFLVPLAAWIAGLAYGVLFPMVPEHLQLLYILGLVVLGWGFWNGRQRAHDLLGAMVTMLAVGALPCKQTYVWLQATALEGALPWLSVGFAFLVVALLLSLYKGEALHGFWPMLCRVNAAIRGSS
jgi:hypothetical protein